MKINDIYLHIKHDDYFFSFLESIQNYGLDIQKRYFVPAW